MTNGYDIRIDVAKGIGMMLLVIGHLLTIDSTGFKIIFGFHMPLFFFLSDYLFTGSKYSVSDFFGKLVEAMSYGCIPFAGNNFSSLIDIIQDRIGGLPKKASIRQWTKELSLFMDNDMALEQISTEVKK